MALYTIYPGRTPEPLGGGERPVFDQWVRNTLQSVTEAQEQLKSLPLGDVRRYIATSAWRHYYFLVREWDQVGRGKRSRDNFETSLIAAVMSAYGVAETARKSYPEGGTTAGGRPMADIGAEYIRACLILAHYVGTTDTAVAACGEDQAALEALRP